ncbi:uncharacterized protein LOC126745136 [Anthonomus grandis grandis]|uniref:uncharacterized protein LOC126745136 n=1 Tax=Anthonomus grandis grandis TaxID=2921223 RepID=UPI002165A8EC|nr:uncharacterized protein LOC126745136 [Anthonomus grandis grandis]
MSDEEFSSDDSVVFQPPIKTKQEAIKRIKGYSPDTIDRRHSSICRYQYLDKTSTSSASEYVTCDTMEFSSETRSLEVHESSQSSSESASNNIIEISDDDSSDNADSKKIIENKQIDTSDLLDHTFEELELLMSDGLDYVMPHKKTTDITNSTEDLSSNLQHTSIDDKYEDPYKNLPERKISSPISGSFLTNEANEDYYPALQTKSYSKSAQKVENKPKIGQKMPMSVGKSLFRYGESKIRPPVVNAKELFGKNKDMREPAFKVPAKPAKSPLRPNLKNIVSPVGIYIKHSPKYCPLIKVPANERLHKSPSLLPKTLYPSTASSLKENIPSQHFVNMEIPSVIYKPAKTRIETVVREVNLPDSIKKLVKPEVVTRHKMRINNKVDESIERRLMESDLSIDTSNVSDFGDVSVVTHKQPFRSGRY